MLISKTSLTAHLVAKLVLLPAEWLNLLFDFTLGILFVAADKAFLSTGVFVQIMAAVNNIPSRLHICVYELL